MHASIGIDFGTSNSALATCGADGQVQVIDHLSHERLLEDGARRAWTTPTVLFFPHYSPHTYVGHDAIVQYLTTGFEGRFIQSIKAFLQSDSFTGTRIRSRSLSIEDLIATFLTRLVEDAKKHHGIRMDGPVVVGRPARFSSDPQAEERASDRLARAVEQAGFKDVRFLIEPVAAALAYESSLDTDETVFVADLGGGTSDFTVMRVGPSYRGLKQRRSSILASGGISVAGDKFDGEIVRAELLPLLGWGTRYRTLTGPARVPNWMYLKLLQWNHVSFLKTRENLSFLQRVADNSEAPDAVEAFVRIVDEDLGYVLYRAVERAKREASQGKAAMIRDEEHGLPIEASLEPEAFLACTRGLVEQIGAAAQEVLAEAELVPKDVDTVFITGGTGLLPSVRAAFEDLFGATKVRSRDAFTSVADGLARSAWSDL